MEISQRHLEQGKYGRYSIDVEKKEVGHLNYFLDNQATMVISHVYVEVRFRGEGYAKQLVSIAVEAARSRGLKVRPDCSYARAVMMREKNYTDIITV